MKFGNDIFTCYKMTILLIRVFQFLAIYIVNEKKKSNSSGLPVEDNIFTFYLHALHIKRIEHQNNR